jgi:hypothetical protein
LVDFRCRPLHFTTFSARLPKRSGFSASSSRGLKNENGEKRYGGQV